MDRHDDDEATGEGRQGGPSHRRSSSGVPQPANSCDEREALGVTGETTWRVTSLSLPDPERMPPFAQFREYEAIRLFVDRAVATAPQFAVTNGNAHSGRDDSGRERLWRGRYREGNRE